jgi:hypothetical protein
MRRYVIFFMFWWESEGYEHYVVVTATQSAKQGYGKESC